MTTPAATNRVLIGEQLLEGAENQRLHTCRNSAQQHWKRVLCVCSAGLLRSATTSHILAQPPFDFNTRACGLEPYALVGIDRVLLTWADEIVCMTEDQQERIEDMLKKWELRDRPVINLNIPDEFDYRCPHLIKLITERYYIALK